MNCLACPLQYLPVSDTKPRSFNKMKRLIPFLCLLAITGFSDSSLAEDSLQNMPDPFTQPGPAAEARVGIHRLMAAQLVDTIRLASGEKKWNGLRFNDRTDALEYLAKMSYEFFVVPGSFEGTKAKRTIIENIDDFKAKTLATETAAMGLAQHSRMHDPKGSMNAVGKLIQSCNACHAEYMEPALLLPLPPKPE